MVFLKNIVLVLTLGTLLMGCVNAQEKEDLIEVKSFNELEQFKGRKVLAGYFSLDSLSSNKYKKGLEEIQISQPTSNFDVDFFRKRRVTIKLNEPLTMDFILLRNKVSPSELFFEKVGSNEYKIIGYSKKSIPFSRSETWFPEFKKVDLINFDLKKNAKKLEGRELVSGGSYYIAIDILAGKKKMSPLDLFYPTYNFPSKFKEKFYMVEINLSEDINHVTLEFLAFLKPKSLIFEKDKGKESFHLVGYSMESFFFKD
jgi:hypothetical protein